MPRAAADRRATTVDKALGAGVGVALGSHASAVESAYGVTLADNRAVLKGVVSRKAQIVPVLTQAFGRG